MGSENHEKTDCEDMAGLISAYFDGELSEEENERIKAHLEVCGECRALYSEFFELSDGIKKSSEIPDDLHECIMRAVKSAERRQTARKISFIRRAGLVCAGAACAVLCMAVLAKPFLSDRNYTAEGKNAEKTFYKADDKMQYDVEANEADAMYSLSADAYTESGNGHTANEDAVLDCKDVSLDNEEETMCIISYLKPCNALIGACVEAEKLMTDGVQYSMNVLNNRYYVYPLLPEDTSALRGSLDGRP